MSRPGLDAAGATLSCKDCGGQELDDLPLCVFGENDETIMSKIDADELESEMNRTSGTGSGSTPPLESQTLVIEPSGSGELADGKATGPRTEQGKKRSSRNATKHGVFSEVVLLKGESKAEYEELLTGLRESHRPEGMSEELLVEKLAVFTWRQRRLLLAEGAEIRKGTEFYSVYKSERDEQEATIFLRAEEKVRVGLFLRADNSFIRKRCIEILKLFEQAIKVRGFNSPADEHLLTLLCGGVEMKATSDPLVLIYRLCSHPGELPAVIEEKELATPAARKATFLKALQDKIDGLQKLPESLDRILGPRARLEELCRKVPNAPALDRLLRYEASLDRSFDRTLSQLERLQRMRLGQPVLPKLEVRHSLS